MTNTSKFFNLVLGLLTISFSSLGIWPCLYQLDAQQRPEFVDGEVLVKFKSRVSRRTISQTLSHAGLAIASEHRALGLLKCSIEGRQSVARAIEECNAASEIEYAEPNYIYHTMVEPNDPLLPDMFGLDNIDAHEAWDNTTGSKSVVVGVIDTGLDYSHEDLVANIWINEAEFGDGRESDGVDDDGNGFVDDFRGWDFLNNDNDPFDDDDHGTHVSGTIGAVGNNDLGTVGVNWSVSIMPLKFLDAEGSGTTDDAIDAIIYATNMGAKILSNSWGGGFSQALGEAIEFANDRGVLFVAAAGNERTNNDVFPSYPASYEIESVVSVASTTSGDNLSSFSNFGKQTVDLAAPGSEILSTLVGDEYGLLSGTSMSTPHVSGAAALILAHFPNLSMRHVKIRLLGSVDKLSNLRQLLATGGRLNVNNALATSPIIANTTELEDSPDEFGPYVVTADIVDDEAVRTAMLTYQLAGEEAVVVEMTEMSADHYRGEIPGQPLGSTIVYVVAATDDAGNLTRGSSFSFSISEPPPDDGGFCGTAAISVGSQSSGWQATAHAALNILFFILPVIACGTLRRGRTREDERMGSI